MRGKALLPASLFGRALLILALPIVLTQLVTAYVFFERHWDNVTRHMSRALAGEVAFFVGQWKASPPERREVLVEEFQDATGIGVAFEALPSARHDPRLDAFPEFQQNLRVRIHEPFSVRKNRKAGTIEVMVLLDGQALRMVTTVKRLESGTTLLFLIWTVGASALFLVIAILFLRNQIRPIRRLAEAAESFGRGVDIPDFRPSGAIEVRKAARAFIVMRERIKRQLRTRAAMLAGISHDLRTPLTRMKLELAMLKDDEAVKELSADVSQMELMIEEYLDFARGEGREEASRLPLGALLEEIAADYRRGGADVVFTAGKEVVADIRVSGFTRMLHNVIDNALRYGKRCDLSFRAAANYCEIVADDEGSGIPEEKRDEVFKPFSRLDPSRNAKTGGVGLGLTIARDIALAHGGKISLDSSPKGGLRVIIRLPL